MGRDQELKWLAFSLYPLSFFLYSLFKRQKIAGIKQKIAYLAAKSLMTAKYAISLFGSHHTFASKQVI